MTILDKLIESLAKKKVVPMLDKLKVSLSGNKTYATIGVGLIVALSGFLFGPIDVPGVGTEGIADIPALTSEEFFKFLWEGVVLAFLRSGVAKSGPQAPKA